VKNIDSRTVYGFGREWSSFDQGEMSKHEREKIFEDYFRLFPWNLLGSEPTGADIGCGSGRWAALVAPRVGRLHLVDASSEALAVAREKLAGLENCSFHHASAGQLPFPDASLDFAYSLGVLHHVPRTADALRSVAKTLKVGAPILVYLYYAFDNRPFWFRSLWKMSDFVRRVISSLPFILRKGMCEAIALLIYWPIARGAWILNAVKLLPDTWPLAYYLDKSLYVMRTDALDRFGTRLEQRFTQVEIRNMLSQAGFVKVQFSPKPPYWCAVVFKG